MGEKQTTLWAIGQARPGRWSAPARVMETQPLLARGGGRTTMARSFFIHSKGYGNVTIPSVPSPQVKALLAYISLVNTGPIIFSRGVSSHMYHHGPCPGRARRARETRRRGTRLCHVALT